MKIFSKKPYVFPSSEGEAHHVTALKVEPVPDWVTKTELFQLAVEARNIEIIPEKEEKAAAVSAAADDELLALRERAKALGVKNASKMGKDRLLKEIAAKEVVKDGDGQQDAEATGGPVPDGDAAAAGAAGG